MEEQIEVDIAAGKDQSRFPTAHRIALLHERGERRRARALGDVSTACGSGTRVATPSAKVSARSVVTI
jgi:hypothetical protein